MSSMETVGAIRARRIRALLRSTRWQAALVAAALVGALLGFAIGGHGPARIGLAIGVAVLFVAVVLVIIWVRATGSAEDDFMTAWGRSHDLTFVETPALGEGTPLLRQGDKRKAENGLIGELDGHPVTLCHYTYTDISYSTDSEGHRTRDETDFPFTVVRFDGVPGSISRMTFHPRNVLDRGWLDKADSALTADRVIELESMELHKKYKLEVRDEVEDVAVRQVFEPSFMVWCIDEKDVFFELERGELIVALKRHVAEQAALDALLERSRLVLKRLVASSASSASSAPSDRSPS